MLWIDYLPAIEDVKKHLTLPELPANIFIYYICLAIRRQNGGNQLPPAMYIIFGLDYNMIIQ